MPSTKSAGASLDYKLSIDLDERRPPHRGICVRMAHGLSGINFVQQRLVLLTSSFISVFYTHKFVKYVKFHVIYYSIFSPRSVSMFP